MAVKHKLTTVARYFRLLGRFIGPGFMVAVGYVDPGNWATDMEGGSQFGYRLLFIILLSNIIAIFLQNLTIRLGTVSGLDLASASRAVFPSWLNLILYVLAEIAIIATDMAEVIGSAIALNLLIPSLPLPAGVAITAADVFIILLLYKDEDSDPNSSMETTSLRLVRLFEMLVMLLVLSIGICLTIILVYSDITAVDVLKGYIPTREIFTDPSCLYTAIGIIGATVMPHNLYLHSFIVQARCREWRTKRPTVMATGTTEWMLKPKANIEKPEAVKSNEKQFEVDDLRHYLEKSLQTNLRYSFVDLVVALLFAFFVNSSILVVAGANFFYGPAEHQQQVSDLFSAHELLSSYLSPAAGVLFALALLFAGQSSTITATLAGQVVMAGFLGMSTRPWVRRILTRAIAIIPALIAACIAGRNGLGQLLVGSQVALSLQLPFAVVPLVIFTSMKRVMKLDIVIEKQETEEIKLSWIDRVFPRISLPNIQCLDKILPRFQDKRTPNPAVTVPVEDQAVNDQMPVVLKELPAPIQYLNGKIVIIIASLISLLLIGLNMYLVVSLGMQG